MRYDTISAILEYAIIACIFLLLCLLVGCGAPVEPVRGTAAEASASASARAESNARAADSAAVDAAVKSAKAVELDRLAKSNPSPANTEAAIAARIDAASAAAVFVALKEQATAAADDAAHKVAAARQEREAELIAADLRSWVKTCRFFGLVGVALGALVGGALSWFVSPKLGIPLGAIVAGTGYMVTAFGATVTWLPLVLIAVVFVALAVWAIMHQRGQRVSAELSRTIDTIEGKADGTIDEAKANLTKAIKSAGLKLRFDSLRKSWQSTVADVRESIDRA